MCLSGKQAEGAKLKKDTWTEAAKKKKRAEFPKLIEQSESHPHPGTQRGATRGRRVSSGRVQGLEGPIKGHGVLRKVFRLSDITEHLVL